MSAGSQLLFNTNSGFNVSATGSLNAIGTATSKILFSRRDSSVAGWSGIQFFQSNSVSNQFDHVIIEYGSGGTATNRDANLILYGQGNRVSVTNSILRNSLNAGFVISDRSTVITSFHGNTITGNAIVGELPASLVDRLNELPSSPNDFSGNTLDVVDVLADTLDATAGMIWPNIGVDYRVESITVDTPVIIEPGITLAMQANSRIWVNSTGTLVAEGTINLPIRITSAAIYNVVGGNAGDWQGMQFVNSINNVLDYTTVEFAGNSGLNGSGNIVLYGLSPGSTVTITNSTIQDSLTAGVWLQNNDSQNPIGLSDGTNSFFRNPDGDIVFGP